LVTLSYPFFADSDNFQNDFHNTVTHEIAHLLAPSLPSYGKRRNPHGPEWRAMHRRLGGNGQRTHTLELADGFRSRRDKGMELPCSNCNKPMRLGPTQAKRHVALIMRGEKGYRHRKCP
jgi:predicted SprT family Zn-dependent metalloprotease